MRMLLLNVTLVIFDNEIKLVKGRLVNKSLFKFELKGENIYSIGGFEEDENFTVSDFSSKDIQRSIKVPIENKPGKNLTLKKGDICAEVNILNESEISVDQVTSYILELKFNEATTGHLSNDEKNKLESILIDYDKSVNPVPVGKSKIPYKHEINLTDDVPIVAQPRVLPH